MRSSFDRSARAGASDVDDELVEAVASELARRTRERWMRRRKTLVQVVGWIAAGASITSALHGFGVI